MAAKKQGDKPATPKAKKSTEAGPLDGLNLDDVEIVRRYIRGDGKHVVTIAARPLGD